MRSGIIIQGGSGSTESDLFDGQDGDLPPRNTGRQTEILPLLGVDVELMTPSVKDLPVDVRFFARGGASYNFASNQDVAKGGSPDEGLFRQEIVNARTDPPLNDILIQGRGMSTTIDYEAPVWTASLGAAFEFEFMNRPARVRVSAEYLRQQLELSGQAFGTDQITLGPIFGGETITAFYALTDSQTQDFDAVGGGLGVEFDAGRMGDFVASVLAEGRVYGWVGGRSVSASQTDTEVEPGPFAAAFGPRTARWRYQLDRVAYRAQLGFRIRWQPE